MRVTMTDTALRQQYAPTGDWRKTDAQREAALIALLLRDGFVSMQHIIGVLKNQQARWDVYHLVRTGKAVAVPPFPAGGKPDRLRRMFGPMPSTYYTEVL